MATQFTAEHPQKWLADIHFYLNDAHQRDPREYHIKVDFPQPCLVSPLGSSLILFGVIVNLVYLFKVL